VSAVTACRSIRTDSAQIAWAAGGFSKYDGHDQNTSSAGVSRLAWDRSGTTALLAHQEICQVGDSGFSGF
jgi:hypothetical protein